MKRASIGNRIALQHLTLQDWLDTNDVLDKLGLFQTLGHLTIDRLTTLTELAKSIGDIHALRHLANPGMREF
jgi:hypothetical protein